MPSLDGALAKLARANTHLEILGQAIQLFRESDPYAIEVHQDDWLQRIDYEFTVHGRILKTPPLWTGV
jgi:hypothetical protein